jgi:outer membrane protein OmpA-like peptidoglycan-associated protein
MTRPHVPHRLSRLCLLIFAGFLAAGCATLMPQEPQALTDLHQADDAIAAAKQAGAADRFPDEFAELEQRYLVARGVFYACQEAKASDLARALVADANALATKRVEVPMPPPPPPAANQAPIARFLGPNEGSINDQLNFDASASSDPEGGSLTYSWDFGDGTIASFGSPVASHRYTSVGNYNVRLTVEDNRGSSDTTMQLVRIVSLEIIRSDVLFDFDRATLKPAAEEILGRIVQQMQEDSSFQAELVGYTDSTGPAEYNMGLSKRRAEAVRDYLITNGIEAQRITTEWKGETDPVASNDTREGRSQNRRTEITLNPTPAMR